MGILGSEPFALGPVQFSWPCGVAENWFTKPGFGSILSVFSRRKSKTQSSLNFLQSGPRKFSKSDFLGLAPIRRVLIGASGRDQGGGTRVALGTVPLQNPKGTSRKACSENPELSAARERDALQRTFLGPRLKGTNLRGQTPICGFLRVPAVFCGSCENQRFFCENLRFPNALFSRKRRESAKICENQRKSAFGLGFPKASGVGVVSTTPVWARFVPLGSSPYARPEFLCGMSQQNWRQECPSASGPLMSQEYLPKNCIFWEKF